MFLYNTLGNAKHELLSDSTNAFLQILEIVILYLRECRASDFFQDLWTEVTHGTKNGGSFSEMMGQSISN